MVRYFASISFLALSPALTFSIDAQTSASSADDTVRVTITLNADGSRTTYQFDNAKHEATATTTDKQGKTRGKVVYRIDDNGRFLSGVVFDPEDKFQFKALYKYDAAGRLDEETHLNKNDVLINKIVYKYSPNGARLGYSVFDAKGKLISGAASPVSTKTAARPHNALGR